MEAINNRLSLSTAAPELSKPNTAQVTAPNTEQEDIADVEVNLSKQAQEALKKDDKKEASQSLAEKQSEEAKTPPPPRLGEFFYNENQVRQQQAKAERQESLEQLEKKLNNYLQYTNNYLAQVAYAKTVADQPIILPQPVDRQDLIDKLNLFA